MRFTAETASFYAKKSHEPNSARNKPKPAPEPAIVAPIQTAEWPQESADPFAVELERAMEETLKELRDADNAKDRAQCAQALRNLRETYHMVTGKPRPGVSKGQSKRDARRPYSSPVPTPIPQPVVVQPQTPSPVNGNGSQVVDGQ